MYRIDGPGSIPAMPARTALSPAGLGWFAQVGPGAGAATRVTGEFLNMLQAELANVVLGGGLILDKADDTQLLASIQALINAAAGADATRFNVEEQAGNFNVVAADIRKMFIVNAPGGGVAVSPAAVATLGDGFVFGVVNRGSGAVTIDPNGAEKIGGRPGPPRDTFVLGPGETAIFAVDLDTSQIDVVAYTPVGSFMFTEAFYASGNWTKTSMEQRALHVEVLGGGGGGGGARVSNGGAGAGGGAGGYTDIWIDVSALAVGATVAVTIGGSGPAGVNGDSAGTGTTAGGNGGTSSFGAYASATGGGGGAPDPTGGTCVMGGIGGTGVGGFQNTVIGQRGGPGSGNYNGAPGVGGCAMYGRRGGDGGRVDTTPTVGYPGLVLVHSFR